jgi:hypothetical protein
MGDAVAPRLQVKIVAMLYFLQAEIAKRGFAHFHRPGLGKGRNEEIIGFAANPWARNARQWNGCSR